MATVTNNQGSAWRRLIKAIEPWYDWGTVETFSLELLSNKAAGRYGDESTGPVRFFTFQWLGLHLHFEIGRTPTREVR